MRSLFFIAAFSATCGPAAAKEEPSVEALQMISDMTRLSSIQIKCDPEGTEGPGMALLTGLVLFGGEKDWTTSGYKKARLNREIAELEVKTNYSCQNWKSDVGALQKKLGMGEKELTDQQRLQLLKDQRSRLDKKP
ncbi:MAG: hypothetical protein K2P94_17210 [Rhodospirillaceae bacterium]|nr:hypothetical protein [Rhodospirillaceae bacterium]